MRRSMLFLPGNNPNMIMNSSFLGADSIILDLEDAVSPEEKDAARLLVSHFLKFMQFGTCEIIIRINSLDTPFWKEDLEKIVPLQLGIIMPTKVSDRDYITTLEQKIAEIEERYEIETKTRIMPLLETAMGVENAFEIARSSDRIEALYLGAEDLTADLRCQRTRDGDEIQYARCRLVNAARAAHIEVYDTPFTSIEDMNGLLQDALKAKSLGFSGKAAIHPKHIETINQVFSPTEKEIQYAQEVYAAIEEAKRLGKGAISLHGKMIDAPIVQRAHRVIETMTEIAARRSGIYE